MRIIQEQHKKRELKIKEKRVGSNRGRRRAFWIWHGFVCAPQHPTACGKRNGGNFNWLCGTFHITKNCARSFVRLSQEFASAILNIFQWQSKWSTWPTSCVTSTWLNFTPLENCSVGEKNTLVLSPHWKFCLRNHSLSFFLPFHVDRFWGVMIS